MTGNRIICNLRKSSNKPIMRDFWPFALALVADRENVLYQLLRSHCDRVDVRAAGRKRDRGGDLEAP